jgi:CRP-like cAMP-binding protein
VELPQSFQTNRLLNGLTIADLALISPHLQHIQTPRGFTVMRGYRTVTHVYFPTSGLISIVGRSGNREIELGIAGREGMVGTAILLGVDATPYEAYSQIAGQAFQLPIAFFITALAESATMRLYLNRYLYAFQVQVSETAISHGVQKIENRLARWLLMCHDRETGNSLPIPHEFLSMMLGVRRASVTTTLDKFRTAGIVSTQRGIVGIVNRAALLQLAGSTYGVAEAEYERVMGFNTAKLSTAGVDQDQA